MRSETLTITALAVTAIACGCVANDELGEKDLAVDTRDELDEQPWEKKGGEDCDEFDDWESRYFKSPAEDAELIDQFSDGNGCCTVKIYRKIKLSPHEGFDERGPIKGRVLIPNRRPGAWKPIEVERHIADHTAGTIIDELYVDGEHEDKDGFDTFSPDNRGTWQTKPYKEFVAIGGKGLVSEIYAEVDCAKTCTGSWAVEIGAQKRINATAKVKTLRSADRDGNGLPIADPEYTDSFSGAVAGAVALFFKGRSLLISGNGEIVFKVQQDTEQSDVCASDLFSPPLHYAQDSRITPEDLLDMAKTFYTGALKGGFSGGAGALTKKWAEGLIEEAITQPLKSGWRYSETAEIYDEDDPDGFEKCWTKTYSCVDEDRVELSELIVDLYAQGLFRHGVGAIDVSLETHKFSEGDTTDHDAFRNMINCVPVPDAGSSGGGADAGGGGGDAGAIGGGDMDAGVGGGDAG